MKLKKEWKILGVLCLILLILLLGYQFIKNEEEQIIFTTDLQIELNDDLSVSNLIKDKNGYEITNVEDKIDTSKLGEQTITIKYKKNQKKLETSIKINIIDTKAPVIECQSELEVKVGEEIDLLKMANVTDNSGEKINLTVEGDYDSSKEGEYNLTYVAIDASGNKTTEKFLLKVISEKEEKTSYPKLVPTGEKKEVGTTEKGFTIYEIDGSIYIDNVLIANKTYPLKDGFVPKDTYTNAEGVTTQCATCINNTAYSAWLDMKSDSAALGLNIWIQSGYRPQSLQVRLYDDYVSRDGKAEADTYSSRPGHSEHQTGLCFDLNSITDAFASTQEGKWVNENAYRYGFIIRFPKGKEKYTGYKYESWHLRYVGTELSYKLYNNGDWISLEEYYGISSEYED